MKLKHAQPSSLAPPLHRTDKEVERYARKQAKRLALRVIFTADAPTIAMRSDARAAAVEAARQEIDDWAARKT